MIMKQLVVYSSKSGNTKKLAEELFRQLQDEKDIEPVASAPAPSGYDVICVGFWFKGGQPDAASQEYLKKCQNKKVFLFATHGAATESDLVKLGMNKAAELTGGATIIGTFSCQGEVPASVLENAANKDPQPPWLQDAPAAKGHPNNDDFINLNEALIEAGLQTRAKEPNKYIGNMVD
jgi:flavodoxin